MITQNEYKRMVLGILSANLNCAMPKVVSIELISKKLRLSSKKTRELLLRMDEAGEIQSDMDGNCSIITQAGLLKHNSYGEHIHIPKC